MLDVLITRYLYKTYSNIDPGELTDLRSASVSNENFAQAAVRRELQPHLQHCSGLLLTQITDYVKSLSEASNTARPVQGSKGPKASLALPKKHDIDDIIIWNNVAIVCLSLSRLWETWWRVLPRRF